MTGVGVRAEVLEAWFPEADEDDVTLAVRLWGHWDDARLTLMVDRAHALLDELVRARAGAAGTGQVDELDLPDLFESALPALVNLLRHPAVLRSGPDGDLEAQRRRVGDAVRSLEELAARRSRVMARLST